LGLFNDSQDVEPVFLWVLLPQTMYPIENRSFMLSELGGEVYGALDLGEGHGRLKYRAHAGEVYLDPNQGYAQQYSQFGMNFSSPPQGMNRGGDLRWETPIGGWTVGASALVQGMDGTSSQGTMRLPDFFVPAFYSQFGRKKLFFAAEYWRAPVNSILTLGSAQIPWIVDQRSWYVMASYRISDKLQIGSYYSHYVNKAANTMLRENYSKDWVISGRYNFNSSTGNSRAIFYTERAWGITRIRILTVCSRTRASWLPRWDLHSKAMTRSGLNRLGWVLVVAMLGGRAEAQDVMVVVNQDVSISEISDTELRDVFTGSRFRFRDGSRAVAVILKGGPAHEVFLRNHVGETTDSFRTLWRKAVFTGQGAAPREFNSEEALLQYVAATPGAIGYVSHVGTGEKIKVLSVQRSGTGRERNLQNRSPGPMH
jgi:hypothetical protein